MRTHPHPSPRAPALQAAYGNYRFKFNRRDDPRLDHRRLVMSQPLTQAAKIFWNDIARPDRSESE